MPCTGHLFQPLENVIREQLIPALVGRSVSDIERRILALPVRFAGGIGFIKPVLSAYFEYSASASITGNLTDVIYNQDKDLTNYDRIQVENNIKLVKARNEQILQDEHNQLLEEVDVKTKRSMALAREKGSGSWLTALRIKSLGYTLNKREFLDSICLRYDWRIPNTTSHCLCGVKNNIIMPSHAKKEGM